MTDRTVKIFKAGSNFDPPVGTGPFKFESWTRGERSLFVRHDEYRDGLPYLDELEFISLNDPNSRVSALQSGQVDALSQVDLTLVDAISGDSSLTLLEKDGANYTNIYMQCNADPFTNNDIRQALRYAIDRQQIIDNALRGKGRLGNDLPCWFDPDFASDIPQREYDPERAKSLLKKAGAEGLAVTLNTSDTSPAMLESSTLYVEHAKAAGIKVTLKRWPTDQYFSNAWNKVPFAADNWGGRPLASQINVGYLKTSPFNESRFFDEDFAKLVKQAFATTDEDKRKQLMVDAQQISWDRGGELVWGFLPVLDAVKTNVRGITPSVIRSMGNYDFRQAWLAS
jgi:peptide/nickel transport system substrate-binding protein